VVAGIRSGPFLLYAHEQWAFVVGVGLVSVFFDRTPEIGSFRMESSVAQSHKTVGLWFLAAFSLTGPAFFLLRISLTAK